MYKSDQIKEEIIHQLENMAFQGDLGDIGNEIGIVIAKYIMKKDADKKGLDLDSFIRGVKHGVSLIDGTH
jgi:hypothetical protein